MITKEQLKRILEEQNIDLSIIDFNKENTSLYERGKTENITEIIKILNKYQLLGLIENCPSILFKGKTLEIKNILMLFSQKNLIYLLKQCPSILAQGHFIEMKDIIGYLEEHKKFLSIYLKMNF